jgi:hypothetical protein
MFDEYGYEDEEWANISGYPNYMISNFGRVFNVKHTRFLKPSLDKDGYEYVCLYKNGKQFNKWISRLVALHFIPLRLGADQVNHDDGDKRYNYVENLEWCTQTENRRHAFRIGLQVAPNKQSIRIVETDELFESLTACAKHIQGSHGAISLCLSGKRKRHKGYTFEYV